MIQQVSILTMGGILEKPVGLGKDSYDRISDSDGNAAYSNPIFFKLLDPDGPNISMSYPNGRPATIRVSDVDANGAILALEIIDSGIGYIDEHPPELSIHSLGGVGGVVSAEIDEVGSIVQITIEDGGTGYTKFDGVSASAPFRYYPGEEFTLSAIANDPFGEISSMSFNVNGVPFAEGNLTGVSLNLSSSYTPMNLVPLFFSVSASSESLNIGDWTKGWLPSWLLQHHHQGGLSAPQWYWGNSDYWPHPAPWQTMPLPPGAAVAEVARTGMEEIEIPNAGMLQEDENTSFIPGSTVTVLVDTDSLGDEVQSVELYANGQPVGVGTNFFSDTNYLNTESSLYQASWIPDTPGTYQLQWMAQGSQGRPIGFSQPVAVNINPASVGGSAPPVTQVLSPQNLDFLTTSSSVFLTASASDPDFDLEKVQFLLTDCQLVSLFILQSVAFLINIPIFNDGNLLLWV